MSKRGIVFIATVALIVLAGCAAQQATTATARSTESDVRPAALAADLVGTWSGWFGAVGAPGSNMAGTMVLEIRDDGTYTMTTQRGASTSNDSGVVVANGRTVTLRSSSGASRSLSRRGDELYSLGPGPTGDFSVATSIVKETGALASPASAPKSQ
jgi:hypothetical protein